MKKILITGGTGFIGSALIQRFLRTDNEVCLLSRNHPDDDFFRGLKIIHANLESPIEYIESIRLFQPEIVFHLAWDGIPDFSSEMCAKNLQNSIDFISNVARMESCKKVIIAGSCFELKNPKGACDAEDDSSPENYFSWAKYSLRKFSEIICETHSVSFAWFRIFYVYGDRQKKSSLIPMAIDSYKRGQNPQIKSPFNSHDFIYIDDLVDLLYRASIVEYKSGVYNASTGKSVSVIDVLKICQELILGNMLSDDLFGGHQKNLSDNRVNYWGSNYKTIDQFGWKPAFDIRGGIREILKKKKLQIL